ncbi:TetR/AcrR family transcriptional regulator [Peribacillus frigoritolerans]|jgi:TetR/AcrR family transcriptional regulator, transcriptional repressor for nem operon|uniref:TetR/AcrR family transcriptional regulator n=1 Tax=Peribacillus frigoritolerans TaxID=450367 RepID=UPI0017890A86|nr:TetR/AcrR family transcriptional regulator [Peribacillus frigoritolerans]MCY8939696.1 TetR/AcrR family transcriptional regulator [Peribacillus frigoritolerans]
MARHKEFDEAEVLRKAMVLFWRNGYEKTSMQDLVDYMNIHRRSIYDTFGDKQTLFLRALQLFEEIIEKRMEQQIKPINSVKLAIRRLFEMAVLSDEEKPPGCLIVNTAVELTLHDQEVADRISKSFSKAESFIYELLLQGQISGEISDQLDIEKSAQFIHNSFIGVRVLAKTTKDKEKLQNIIDSTLKVLD